MISGSDAMCTLRLVFLLRQGAGCGQAPADSMVDIARANLRRIAAHLGRPRMRGADVICEPSDCRADLGTRHPSSGSHRPAVCKQSHNSLLPLSDRVRHVRVHFRSSTHSDSITHTTYGTEQCAPDSAQASAALKASLLPGVDERGGTTANACY